MKKIIAAIILVLLACLAQAQMPVFRNQFTTNVPGAYVRGNTTFGTGAAGTYTFNGQQLLYVDALGGVDFMIGTNVYGTGTPLFILNNGTIGINRDSQPTYSISANSYWAQTMTADTRLFSPAHWFGETGGLPRLNVYGGGVIMLPQIGTTNWWVWGNTNGTPVSVVNSNGWFGIQTLTPEAPLQVDGTVLSTNFQLTVPQWNDVRIPLGSLSSPSAQPGKVKFISNLTTYAFDDASTEQLDFELQLPHGIATNQEYGIEIHIHWTGTNVSAAPNTNVVWGLEWVMTKPYSLYNATSQTNYVTNGLLAPRFHTLAEFPFITNGIGESSVMVGRLWREGGNAADTYVGDAYGLSLDAHVPVLKFGSTTDEPDY